MTFVPTFGNLLVETEDKRSGCCIARVVVDGGAEINRHQFGASIRRINPGAQVVFLADAGIDAPQFGERAVILHWDNVLGMIDEDDEDDEE